MKIQKMDEWRFQQVSRYVAGQSVLDVGCGNKRMKVYLPDNTFYIGLDIVKSKRPDVVAHGGYLPFKNESFDTVLLLEVLEHVECPLFVLKECVRVSKRRVIISVPNPYALFEIGEYVFRKRDTIAKEHISKFGINEMRNLCSRAGLRIITIEDTALRIPTFTRFELFIPLRTRFGRWKIFVCEKIRS
ncbi:hypothetical protein DRP04_15735 [Archaeoglobales archaeon]|nr:MAG: hypothetical protein DRP04_15735 [Archaeoglobales archaeon]